MILSKALDYAYSKYGWHNDSTRTINPGKKFNFTDFFPCFEEVFNSYRYQGQARDILSAAKVRLESLMPYFDTYAEIPLSEICSGPTVIELGYIQQPEVKSVILVYLLKLVRLYVEEQSVANPQDNNGSRLLFVMDEAHCILNALDSGDNTNSAQKSVVGMINNMLDEVRKYGLSMVFADQTASVLLNIMAKTHTQIVLNLQLGNREVGEIIGLEKYDKLRKLQPGEAFVKDMRVSVPVHVKTPPRIDKLKDVNDEEATQLMDEFWERHSDLTKPYPMCKYCILSRCDNHIRTVGQDVPVRIIATEGNKEGVLQSSCSRILKDAAFCKKYIGVNEYKDTKFAVCALVHISRQMGWNYLPIREVFVISGAKKFVDDAVSQTVAEMGASVARVRHKECLAAIMAELWNCENEKVKMLRHMNKGQLEEYVTRAMRAKCDELLGCDE